MTFFVGICGGTGSGKTTLAENLQAEFGSDRSTIVSLDSYYADLHNMPLEERALVNYDHPNSIDAGLLALDLDQLKAGKECATPTYDFNTHSRTPAIQIVEPKQIVIVEGILLFAFESLRSRMDYLVFTDAPERIRFERRMRRDINERGRSELSIRNQWNATVKPMHDLFVEPLKHKAHFIAHNENSPLETANFAATAAKQVLASNNVII